MTTAAQLTTLASQINSGGFHLAARNFAYPLPIFLGNTTTVAETPEQVGALLRQLRVLVRARGYRRLVPRMASVELPRRGRFRVWVDWIGDGPTGQQPLFRTVCYNHGSAEDNLTQMVRVETLALPRRASRRKAA
ncbi:hypothetical protein LHP98_15925 [Rhodobacter sp. Har01]|uniref:hypothetical protein n=1 Tax=Rhodobacter sp. Har01 TaxID=2883999 RepID=UPI001D06EBA0|nr:hypothetical protein [Rhodobacter sp. Har01]MCB6179610.1 hypothetical protein [Rhodobacter sp. Har01]